jgi:hypothetical protein
MIRTTKQNRALHLYFTLLAKKMAEQGLDMKKALKPSVEITPTMELCKEYLFRPIMRAKYDKESTTELTTKELQGVIQDLDRFFLSKHKIDVPFPSAENLHLLEQLIKEYGI